jgi:hypothetical protein
MLWNRFSRLRTEFSMGSYENSNELSGSIKGREFVGDGGLMNSILRNHH